MICSYCKIHAASWLCTSCLQDFYPVMLCLGASKFWTLRPSLHESGAELNNLISSWAVKSHVWVDGDTLCTVSVFESPRAIVIVWLHLHSQHYFSDFSLLTAGWDVVPPHPLLGCCSSASAFVHCTNGVGRLLVTIIMVLLFLTACDNHYGVYFPTLWDTVILINSAKFTEDILQGILSVQGDTLRTTLIRVHL